MGALMLTATHAQALLESPVRTGRPMPAVLGDCSVLERAGWEVVLDVSEPGASMPLQSVGWMHVRANPIAATAGETIDAFTRRMDAGFVAAWRSGASVTLARFALAKRAPAWGWAGRRTFLEALVRRTASQAVEHYEIAVVVLAPPQSEEGQRCFDLFDQLMHVADTRGSLRLLFAH